VSHWLAAPDAAAEFGPSTHEHRPYQTSGPTAHFRL